jgi:hypothetical protein
MTMGKGWARRHENSRQRTRTCARASHEHAGKIKVQVKVEVVELMAKAAEAADQRRMFSTAYRSRRYWHGARSNCASSRRRALRYASSASRPR